MTVDWAWGEGGGWGWLEAKALPAAGGEAGEPAAAWGLPARPCTNFPLSPLDTRDLRVSERQVQDR